MAASTLVRRLHILDEEDIAGLAALLIDCVDDGAAVSFLHPLAPDEARDFWRQIGAGIDRGARALLVAEDETGILGTVQLVLEQPENQPHRADLAKMLVDTNEGSEAERLYTRAGWKRVGRIPNYSVLPRGGLHATVMYYKEIEQR